MPDVNNWMAEDSKAGSWLEDIENDYRSEHFTHRIISEKPANITIQRRASDNSITTLSAQTVRIETTRIAPDKEEGPLANMSRANAVVIGYKNHPTVADTDIQQGDRFVYESQLYEVRHIFPATPGSVQAWVEVIT